MSKRKYLLVAVGVMGIMFVMSGGDKKPADKPVAPVAQVEPVEPAQEAEVNHEVLDQASYCAGIMQVSGELFKANNNEYQFKLFSMAAKFGIVAANHGGPNKDKAMEAGRIQLDNINNRDDKAFAKELQQCIDWGSTLD